MGGWTLDALRSMDADEYDELVAWVIEEADRAKHGDDSTDMDAFVQNKLKEQGGSD